MRYFSKRQIFRVNFKTTVQNYLGKLTYAKVIPTRSISSPVGHEVSVSGSTVGTLSPMTLVLVLHWSRSGPAKVIPANHHSTGFILQCLSYNYLKMFYLKSEKIVLEKREVLTKISLENFHRGFLQSLSKQRTTIIKLG
jgi:hypothetical protein